MKRILRASIWAFALLAFGTAAPSARSQAEKPPSNAEQYRIGLSVELRLCEYAFTREQLQIEAASYGVPPEKLADFEGCVSGARSKELAMFKKNAPLFRGTSRQALNATHAAFVAALEGMRPGDDERKITYAARQQALRDRLTEALARFEAEQP